MGAEDVGAGGIAPEEDVRAIEGTVGDSDCGGELARGMLGEEDFFEEVDVVVVVVAKIGGGSC